MIVATYIISTMLLLSGIAFVSTIATTKRFLQDNRVNKNEKMERDARDCVEMWENLDCAGQLKLTLRGALILPGIIIGLFIRKKKRKQRH